eukprot:2449060-Pleurochrysis_carterae.AAC.1
MAQSNTDTGEKGHPKNRPPKLRFRCDKALEPRSEARRLQDSNVTECARRTAWRGESPNAQAQERCGSSQAGEKAEPVPGASVA